ncbi:MAG: type IV pilus modification protein PilV [Gammaproteobacteria bacterium]|nr:type IV pilus modification protein PilV [Gammaproteobacteria bacterium]MBU1831571.1 type IV pilus modification protein PilV [Gammaproteobacteria bacterium]
MSKNVQVCRSRSHQRGVTLVEVLVAVLITATGVLGAAALQLNSTKFNQLANTRSAAVFLANDMADRLRANRERAVAGNYDLALDADAPNGDTINDVDRREWLTELGLRLPEGDGSVVRDGSTFTITVQWNESRLAKTRDATAADTESFVFITEL